MITVAGGVTLSRGSPVPELLSLLIRCIKFSICAKLVGHLLVCGWLRAATAVLKR